MYACVNSHTTVLVTAAAVYHKDASIDGKIILDSSPIRLITRGQMITYEFTICEMILTIQISWWYPRTRNPCHYVTPQYIRLISEKIFVVIGFPFCDGNCCWKFSCDILRHYRNDMPKTPLVIKRWQTVRWLNWIYDVRIR